MHKRGYLKHVLHAEVAKTSNERFPGLSSKDKARIDLFFDMDWDGLKAIVDSPKSSAVVKAYAKDQLDNLKLIAWDKKHQQRS